MWPEIQRCAENARKVGVESEIAQFAPIQWSRDWAGRLTPLWDLEGRVSFSAAWFARFHTPFEANSENKVPAVQTRNGRLCEPPKG